MGLGGCKRGVNEGVGVGWGREGGGVKVGGGGGGGLEEGLKEEVVVGWVVNVCEEGGMEVE